MLIYRDGGSKMRRVTCRIRISFSLYRSTPHAKDTTHHASIHVAFPSFMCEPSEVERLNFSYMLPSLMFISVMRFQYAKDERALSLFTWFPSCGNLQGGWEWHRSTTRDTKLCRSGLRWNKLKFVDSFPARDRKLAVLRVSCVLSNFHGAGELSRGGHARVAFSSYTYVRQIDSVIINLCFSYNTTEDP